MTRLAMHEKVTTWYNNNQVLSYYMN